MIKDGLKPSMSREVIIANIDVLKRIFRPGKNISPQLFELPLTHKAVLSRVIYANAITMTPGTVSLNLNKETITVYSLSIEAATDLRSGRMAMLYLKITRTINPDIS